MVESHHVQLGVCVEVHCAGDTGNVLVTGLVHRGEQVKEGVPGGVEGHGAFFISMKLLRLRMALVLTTTRGLAKLYKKGSLQGILAMRCKLPLCAGHRYPLETCRYLLGTGVWRGIRWRHAGIHWIPESGAGRRFPLIPSLLLPPNNMIHVPQSGWTLPLLILFLATGSQSV